MREQDKAGDARTVYGDIIDRKHHVSSKHPQMPRSSRAAQFAPYATLKGYEELVRESARETDARRILDENEIAELNDKLVFLLQQEDPPEVTITVFVPDERKDGGRYEKIRGTVVRFDEWDRCLTLGSGEVIRVENILSIQDEGFASDRDFPP